MTRASDGCSDNKIIIRSGSEQDALRLSKLSANLFHQAYADKMSADTLATYIAEDFGEIQTCTELADPTITTLLADIENVMMGYAQLRLQPIPVAAETDVNAELWRIYVDRSCHRLGIGRQLLSRLGSTARAMGHDKIWLGVGEQNVNAIAFYKKLGFVEAGSQPFPIGDEIHNDLIFTGFTNAF